jgi:hypothetical protein
MICWQYPNFRLRLRVYSRLHSWQSNQVLSVLSSESSRRVRFFLGSFFFGPDLLVFLRPFVFNSRAGSGRVSWAARPPPPLSAEQRSATQKTDLGSPRPCFVLGCRHPKCIHQLDVHCAPPAARPKQRRCFEGGRWHRDERSPGTGAPAPACGLEALPRTAASPGPTGPAVPGLGEATPAPAIAASPSAFTRLKTKLRWRLHAEH